MMDDGVVNHRNHSVQGLIEVGKALAHTFFFTIISISADEVCVVEFHTSRDGIMYDSL
jgi:hypothetical protein